MRLNLDLRLFDIEQAFVQSDLDENVYMRLPLGCIKLSGNSMAKNKLSGDIRPATSKRRRILVDLLRWYLESATPNE